ncbi:MAG TPA: hypothetical protein VG759_14870, partial [Candidatus Angelobacter sp.]|nr:hypothetical protein [Candidatus Angelobacter sp.]
RSGIRKTAAATGNPFLATTSGYLGLLFGTSPKLKLTDLRKQFLESPQTVLAEGLHCRGHGYGLGFNQLISNHAHDGVFSFSQNSGGLNANC